MTQFEKRLLTKFVLEGRLNGSELNEMGVKNYIATSRKLEEQKSNFRMKVDKATNSFAHIIQNPNEVRDFPSELLRATALDRYILLLTNSCWIIAVIAWLNFSVWLQVEARGKSLLHLIYIRASCSTALIPYWGGMCGKHTVLAALRVKIRI